MILGCCLINSEALETTSWFNQFEVHAVIGWSIGQVISYLQNN